MLQAVLWDFGGVITTSPFESFNRYEQEQGLPKDFIRSVNATNPDGNAWAQLESSQIDLEEFDRLFMQESEALGHSVSGKAVLGLLAGDVRPRMLDALRIIKTKYSIACITNNISNTGHGPGMARSQEKAEQMAEVMALFDFVIESSVVGLRKPDPRIYQLALDKMGVQAEQALFLDDLGINLKPARALGMATIKVVSEQQALQDLSRVLELELPWP